LLLARARELQAVAYSQIARGFPAKKDPEKQTTGQKHEVPSYHFPLKGDCGVEMRNKNKTEAKAHSG